MDVQLQILQGRLKQGDQTTGVDRFRIPVSRFVIGGDPSCHMVCKSRTISPRHCLIATQNDQVFVRDLDSAAGTLVNGKSVTGMQLLRDGDLLRIGRLEFRLVISGVVESAPNPADPTGPPDQPREPQVDTVAGSEMVDTLVTDLLQEEDEAAREARYADPAARYFRAERSESASSEAAPDAPSRSAKKRPPEKRGVGKLPPPPPITAKDTVSAAELALEELFRPDQKKRPG